MDLIKVRKNRLFQILYYILEKGKVTAPELAKKFEVSIRTIYRDIDTISSIGVPIYTTQGKDGGISILDTFILEKSFFTESEQELIINALQGLPFIEKKESEELLSKFSSLFQIKATNWIEVDFSSWKSNQPTQEQFNNMKEAILNQNMISFQYINNLGEMTERELNPCKLVFKSGNWYVYGYCHLRKEYCLFKLTRIKSLKMLKSKFSLQVPSPTYLKEIFSFDLIEIELKFDKKMAFRVCDEFSEDISTDAQGNLYVTTKLPNNATLYSYILSFASDIEVISPPQVREQLKLKIKK